jgi:hypothetical protein
MSFNRRVLSALGQDILLEIGRGLELDVFTQMNTRDLPAPRVVPYFKGGLFTDATTLPLRNAQLMPLTKAAEANWSFVDPHIFGSVCQGIMAAHFDPKDSRWFNTDCIEPPPVGS